MGKTHPLSLANRESFHKARKVGAICVIATGRSLRGAEEVLDSSFPLDYLVFSSGAGILDWKTKNLIHRSALESEQIRFIDQHLRGKGLDYTIQGEAPDSHLFFHTPLNKDNSDFFNRVRHQSAFGAPLLETQLPAKASEFIIIDSSPDSHHTFEKLHRDLSKEFNVVRATSPVDGRSLWIEIFPLETSKAHASDFLRRRHEIEIPETYALGNDYNDLQLLSWAGNPLVVGDAVPLLREKYRSVKVHTENAFANAVEIWIKEKI
jgi:HAD superfamily hydrolase (TIGR01484 family)